MRRVCAELAMATYTGANFYLGLSWREIVEWTHTVAEIQARAAKR